MIRTIKIDDSNLKAKALIEYLLTLDFVKIENDDFILTDEHLEILKERRENHLSGKSKSYSWDEIKNSLGSRND